jgi:replicative DNA helicase
MPHNLEIEESLLAAFLLFSDEGFDILKPEHFYGTNNSEIFSAMSALRSRLEPLEATLVLGELKSRKKDPAEYTALVGRLLDTPLSTDPVVYAEKLVGLYQLREYIKIANAATKRAMSASPDEAPSVAAYLQAEIARIECGRSSTWKHLGDVVGECMDIAEEMAKRGGLTGVTSGFRDLDWYTCGFQPGDLVILAARPGMGKTAFAVNSIGHAARAGQPSGILSLEMERHQVGNRFLSCRSSINAIKFRSGRFIPDDWDRMVSAAGELSQYGVWIDDTPRANYKDVARKCKALVQRQHARIVWIDYLGFLEGDKQDGKVQEIESITRALKQTAKDLCIPIVLLCQLSRKCEERPNKRPILSDLRDSGAIEQDADVVMFLYRESYYRPECKDPLITELSISKQRNGPTGIIQLLWQEEFTRFQNLEKRMDPI